MMLCYVATLLLGAKIILLIFAKSRNALLKPNNVTFADQVKPLFSKASREVSWQKNIANKLTLPRFTCSF